MDGGKEISSEVFLQWLDKLENLKKIFEIVDGLFLKIKKIKNMEKLLNRWFCYTLVLLCSTMYAQPCTFEDIVKEIIYLK